ncbi:hypothetical protein ACFQVC_36210 [Streptomyces monticola]|uniref:Lipoprotein n=1 Tax=Streptomyces monticola TaxID=2666263 RepID=A0ABW2JTY4_9ACTN
MRAISLAATALVTASALTLAAPTAQAAVTAEGDITSFGFSVTPSTIAAGGQVTLKVDDCDSEATATSGVFDMVKIPKGQTATATVDWDAKPGAMYTVTFDCGGEKGTTDLTIATGGGSTGGSSTGGMSTGGTHTGGTHHRGVKAGIGGSLSDLDFGEIALGAALIAGALGSAYYWARRRPAGDDA